MNKKIFVGLLCCVFCIFGARAETCVSDTYNVVYTCNGGELWGALPANATATYGAYFSPESISKGVCTPPYGYMYSPEWAIVSNGAVVAHSAFGGFDYLYTNDIEIGPHWIPVEFNRDAFITSLGTPSLEPETRHEYYYIDGPLPDVEYGVSLDTYYGRVVVELGVSIVEPDNEEVHVADDDMIVAGNASNASNACYAKLLEPYYPESKWVYVGVAGNAMGCSEDLWVRMRKPHFKSALFSAVLAE